MDEISSHLSAAEFMLQGRFIELKLSFKEEKLKTN